MLSFFFLYPHLYPRFVFATPLGTHDAAGMRWGGNPEELNPCSSPQHRLQPAWGPLHLTPLGDVRNSPRVRLELPAWQLSRENLGSGWGACLAIGQQEAPRPKQSGNPGQCIGLAQQQAQRLHFLPRKTPRKQRNKSAFFYRESFFSWGQRGHTVDNCLNYLI